MTPKALMYAVADALIESRQADKVVLLMKEPDAFDRVGQDLFNQGLSDLGLGIMHAGDAMGLVPIIALGKNLPERERPGISSYNDFARRAAESLSRIPGVKIPDEELYGYWRGDLASGQEEDKSDG